MPTKTAVAAPSVDPKEELRLLLWALLFKRLGRKVTFLLDGVDITDRIEMTPLPLRDDRAH